MKVGTKSLLFGVHQFILHPLAVLVCWRRLYGRHRWWEVICIVVHDWGYWGCNSMNGEDGARHPEFGGQVAYQLVLWLGNNIIGAFMARDLVEGHSRTYARLQDIPVGRMCAADKLASALWPWWVYLPLARLSGELAEYREEAALYHAHTGRGIPSEATDREWYAWMCEHMQGAARGEDVSYSREVKR